MEVPSLKGELRDLIARYLELYYVSESSKDGINTENRYQSIRMGDLEVPGVRSLRDAFLDQVSFDGKRVLDLGSNLGELSRGARARGASLVDGFEYDPFFVELARAIDTYGQVTRVSYDERDITDPSVYRDHYDVVLAFSVFVYIEPVLAELASITDELFVLETHRLEDNLEEYYVRVVGRHFPHYAILGESDWDVRLGGEADRRAVIAFAKDEPTLLEALREGPAGEAPLNVMRTAVARRPGEHAPSRHIRVDLTRPPREALQQRFFMMFRFDSLDELLDAVDPMEVDVGTLTKSREIRNLGAEGWIYWFLFTKGYIQYLEAGTVGDGNVYFDYLFRHYIEQGHDPGALWQLAEHDLAVERVARRYRDLDALRRDGARSPEPRPDTEPVRVTVNDWPRDPPLHLYEVGAGEPLPVRHLDGWHRLCSARLSGLDWFPCEAIPENLHDRAIRGAVEEFRLGDGRLAATGWFLDPEHRLNWELRAGRRILAVGTGTERGDIAKRFPHLAERAETSGFDIDIDCDLPADVPTRFDLVVMHEIFPAGVMPILHVPGVESAEEATLVYQLLRPIVRRRALDSFEAALEVRPDGVALAAVFERLVPGASVTAVEAAAVADAGADSADLVIAHAVLPALGRAQQLTFLEALRPVVKPGGYVAATLQGELVRPFLTSSVRRDLEAIGISDDDPFEGGTTQTMEHVLDAVGSLFQVADYVKGGVGNRYDLVILRKA